MCFIHRVNYNYTNDIKLLKNIDQRSNADTGFEPVSLGYEPNKETTPPIRHIK